MLAGRLDRRVHTLSRPVPSEAPTTASRRREHNLKVSAVLGAGDPFSATLRDRDREVERVYRDSLAASMRGEGLSAEGEAEREGEGEQEEAPCFKGESKLFSVADLLSERQRERSEERERERERLQNLSMDEGVEGERETQAERDSSERGSLKRADMEGESFREARGGVGNSKPMRLEALLAELHSYVDEVQ
ncbi:hypothetical protein KIPB_005927 [Kipferlia bialata]|uniref:Uncharacterized protein n=1 Tax=Kipferlia bialata TaxID=797122 RepID=A0A391NLI3_9EUKA|nr:hypothetical protein KIPB_005927 [Kipferlia bialata]|eukprot:g5927.t1